MGRLIPAPEALLCGAAPDAQVKMIVVRVAPRRLVKNPGRSQHGARGALVPGSEPKKTRLELVGAEQPLHPGLVVHHERAHQVPVARFVEAVDPLTLHGEPETIELHPACGARRDPPRITSVEQQVRVAASPVAAMPCVDAAARARQVTDAKRIPARKCECDLAGGTLDGPDERARSVARALPGANTCIPFASIRKRDRLSEVPPVGCPDGDRLPRPDWLGRAGADRSDCEYREKPNHSQCMIAHGSA